MEDIINRLKSPDSHERGQILVILALAMVGLLVAAGLAVDGGVLFMRKAQLDRATDAAALSGVTVLATTDSLNEANVRGLQLMAANNIFIDEMQATSTGCESADWTTYSYCGARSVGNAPGSIRYAVDTQWEAETYFLPLVGFSTIPLRASATAEYLPKLDLFASDTASLGLIKASNAAIFGPDQSTTGKGDPYTPTVSSEWGDLRGVYNYRIRIPQGYQTGPDAKHTIRVEIYDPSTGNVSTNSATVYDLNGATSSPICSDLNQRNPCNLPTGDTTANPFWFVRLDENRDGSTYDRYRNTATLFRLYYLEQADDGSLKEVDLAYYIGKPDYPSWPLPINETQYDSTQAQTEALETDLRWVSPGAPLSERMPAFTLKDVFWDVSTYSGNGTVMSEVEPQTYTEDCYQYRLDHDGVDGDPVDPSIDPDLRALGIDFTDASRCEGNGDFIVDLTSEVPGIYVDPLTGTSELYLDVRGIYGQSENGFAFWAGPARSEDAGDDDYTVPSYVNARQIYMLRRQADGTTVHSSEGVNVYGIGHLPMNSNVLARTDIPLAYLGPEFSGQQIKVQLFDSDTNAQPPISFYFDTIPKTDWTACYDDDPLGSHCDDVGGLPSHRLGPDQTPNDNAWATYSFTIPSEADPLNPIPFYGGRLQVSYVGGKDDTYGWKIVIESRPYLVK